MKDEDKTKTQLITELVEIRQRIARWDREVAEWEINEEEIDSFIDFRAIQELMDYLHKVTKIGIAILDLKGNILVATGWQDICVKFHRVHPETLRNCIESDLFLSRNVEQGRYILYKCKNNMWDIATPIIAGNRHIANLYLGQFFFEDEAPDNGIFMDQAKKYGFDEKEYLTALERTPRWSRETVQSVMEFYTRFADLVSKLSYGNIKLVRLLSRQRQAEHALRESEKRYKQLLDSVTDYIYTVQIQDKRPVATVHGPGCAAVTGYTSEDYEADPHLWYRMVYEQDRDAVNEQAAGILAGEPVSPLEHRIIHRDGSLRWVRNTPVPHYDDRRQVVAYDGLITNITERKQAEQALQESSEKLKLFAYSVAHDLKSPAIGVYGLTRRLSKHAKDALDDKGRNYCDQILKVSEHIAALVDKVNVYIATKEARLYIETINIAEILHILKDEFSAQLSIRQIDWLDPEAPVKIKADRLSILRVFRNFVDNSLKYGGEQLNRIWTGYEESEEFHILSFSNNGKGLKEDDSERIFGAFQRDESSRGVEGAGLGLTIVKEIAEQHGGKVWVEPGRKKDVTFYISISKNL